MRKEVCRFFLIEQPHQTLLSLPADRVKVVNPTAGLAAREFAVIKLNFDASLIAIFLNFNADNVCSLPCIVIVEEDGVTSLLAKVAGMVALGELATRTANPLETLIRGVTVLLSGAVQSFTWSRPYRWSDLMLPVEDIALVLVSPQQAS